MRVVLDTNVVISGVFFGGVPGCILEVVVSGDQDLRRVSGWRGIEVLTPRQFVDRHLGA